MQTGQDVRMGAMRDALVTVLGGSGFAGRYVVRALLAAGARVRIAGRDPRRALYLRSQGGLGQTQFVAIDVLRRETLDRAVAGSDAVVNLVGTFGPGMAAVHGDGAANAAQAAAAARIDRYVHLSAIGADAASDAAYGRSKAAGEDTTREALPTATILRPSVMFGREDAFINRFARMIRIAPVVPVMRPGVRFQPVFVGDVADAAVAVLARPDRHAGRTYALGGPDVMTMRALMEWIARQIGRDATLVDLPDAVGGAIASLGFLPGAPIDADQWRMLQHDNVVTGEDGLAATGVAPTPLDAVAPGWLVQYRRRGRFAGPVGA